MIVLLYLLMFGFWIALVSYVLWFIFKAKTVQALTLDDLALTWKVHKNQKGCAASRIHSLIKEDDEVIGFSCDCGYMFIQKRLTTQMSHERKATTNNTKTIPNLSENRLFEDPLKRVHMNSFACHPLNLLQVAGMSLRRQN